MRTIEYGRSVTTTATTEVDLLSTATGGIGLNDIESFGFSVKNDAGSAESVAVKVYMAWGENVGLVEMTSLGATLTAGQSLVVERPEGFTARRIRVTATPAGTGSTTTTCDFRGRLK